MVKNKNSQRSHAPAVSDPRFARAQHDPRFLRPKKEAFQVVLDDRFKDLLHPDSSSKRNGAKGKGKVDKYGRPISEEQQKQNQIQQLKGLYRIEGQQDDDDEEEEEDESEEDEDEDAADDDDHELPTTQPGAQVDYARGEGELLTSSDEDDDTSDEEEDDLPADQDDSYSSVDEDELQATTAQPASMSQRQAKSEEMRGERTRRLAIVNMDWDHIRARDLFMVFSSLVSPTAPKLNKGKAASASSASRSSSLMTNGRVLSVRVYPSEFGRERMKKEDIEGPPRDIFRSADSQQASSSSSSSRKKRKNKKGRGGDEEDDEEEEEAITVKSIIQVDEGGDFDEEALRKYQLERLRYYYAVAEFDSTEAASHVYNEIDGTEMERSANVFDLRFIPDEMEFPSYPLSAATDEDDPTKQDGWRDEYTQDSLEPGSSTASSKYRPLDFKTDALRHSRVKLTWDADDPERTRITKNIFAPSASAAAKKGGGKKGKKNPNILTLDEMRDDDFRAYLASATEDEDEDEGEEGGAESSRARFRALLNLDGSADGEAGSGGSEDEETSKPPNPLKAALASSSKAASVWGRSRAPNGQVEGEMEITFTPGLSEAKARKELKQKKQNKSGGAGAEEEEDETTLDKYVRKQREKKERRKARQVEAGPNGDEGGAGEEQDGEGLGFDDPFFADDGDLDADMEAALAAHDAGESAPQPRSQPNPKKSAQQQQAQERDGEEPARKSKTQAKREAKLERKRKRKLAKAGIVEDDSKEGIDSDDDDDGEDGGRKARAEQGEFDVDVADERFQAVLEDHRFAIDPSHKAWKETKGMRKLVDERRKKARRT
ncbi:pre-rRNA-processing protein esf1 [Tilletia horrida]|uniref:Pre-rRNA-processing protein esf1 n=1 Tax=Tilletia horrida TaxID=155126 RepID=A0AAN6JYB1_9BASI|nr:pre-rRNA-processing protein esf1 [Tilletia horrida]